MCSSVTITPRVGSTGTQVEIHPDTAKDLGIEDGEWVAIENDRGHIPDDTHSQLVRLSKALQGK